jgi:hypothetical protein
MGGPNKVFNNSPARCFHHTKQKYEHASGLRQPQDSVDHVKTLNFWQCPFDVSKTMIRLSATVQMVKHEVSVLENWPNLTHNDSKPFCFFGLGHSLRHPAIDFLIQSGSKAPDPSQTSAQAMFANTTFKCQGFGHRRAQKHNIIRCVRYPRHTEMRQTRGHNEASSELLPTTTTLQTQKCNKPKPTTPAVDL